MNAVGPAARKARQAGDASVEAGRVAGQMGWYKFATQFVRGKSVLDVGCGLGKGLKVLSGVAKKAVGLDIDSRLERRDVIITTVDKIPAKSFDTVVAIDVIEHVEDDECFARHLGRIARECVFVTTPNWTISRCQWPYHVREYTPKQLEQILSIVGKVQLYKGNSSGTVVEIVRHPQVYHMLNNLRHWSITAFVTRCVNHFLPSSLRIHGHNAALVGCKARRSGLQSSGAGPPPAVAK